ncbi:MAG: hypothetical protein KatS3mg003_0984 [Candidatus Nitrosocaldaceae archaeon]|nr:MAG: hypothetical protein KatS3mg003_0984 [Candidatus Nitrosocaldaceae archaeon]
MSRKLLNANKEQAIDNTVRDIINVLNDSITVNDLTYEEVLTIIERVKLHILAKYIDFRLTRMVELTSRIYEKEGNKV